MMEIQLTCARSIARYFGKDNDSNITSNPGVRLRTSKDALSTIHRYNKRHDCAYDHDHPVLLIKIDELFIKDELKLRSLARGLDYDLSSIPSEFQLRSINDNITYIINFICAKCEKFQRMINQPGQSLESDRESQDGVPPRDPILDEENVPDTFSDQQNLNHPTMNSFGRMTGHLKGYDVQKKATDSIKKYFNQQYGQLISQYRLIDGGVHLVLDTMCLKTHSSLLVAGVDSHNIIILEKYEDTKNDIIKAVDHHTQVNWVEINCYLNLMMNYYTPHNKLNSVYADGWGDMEP